MNGNVIVCFMKGIKRRKLLLKYYICQLKLMAKHKVYNKL
jgi:hypothetical protein